METETITKRSWIPDWKWMLLSPLFIFVILFSVTVGVPIQREQVVIKKIERLGGYVRFSGLLSNRIYGATGIGVSRVQGIDFSSTVTSDVLLSLKKLTLLEYLWFIRLMRT